MTETPSAATGEVRVIRSGGFAGLRMERVVDPDQLDDDTASNWRGLLTSSLLRELTDQTDPPGTPDGYTYRLVAPQQGLDVTAAESQLPDEVRALLNRTLKDPL